MEDINSLDHASVQHETQRKGITPSTFIALTVGHLSISPIFNTVSKIIMVSIIIPSIRFALVAYPLAVVILSLSSHATYTNTSNGGFTCLLLSLNILFIMREWELFRDVIFCIKIISRSQYLLMYDGNVASIGHIQRIEVIICHESNIFYPLKGPLFVNYSAIILHLPETLSIEH